METKSSEFAQAKEEDVPTSVAMKQNKDKDLTANLSGTVAAVNICVMGKWLASKRSFEVRKLSKKNSFAEILSYIRSEITTLACSFS